MYPVTIPCGCSGSEVSGTSDGWFQTEGCYLWPNLAYVAEIFQVPNPTTEALPTVPDTIGENGVYKGLVLAFMAQIK